jgi:flagella basal body P-ring formation protein FlgA
LLTTAVFVFTLCGAEPFWCRDSYALEHRGTPEFVDFTDPAGVLRAHIARTAHCLESDVELRSFRYLNGTEPTDGSLQVRIMQDATTSGYRNVILGMELRREGKFYRTCWILVDASVQGRFLRASKRIPYGANVGPGDFELVCAEMPDLRAEYFTVSGDVVGKTARRTLSPGDPLTRDALSDPILVRAGEKVRVRLERGAISLAALAQAEQNGKLGQSIRIRNIDFARVMQARVVARGEVQID